VTEHCTAGDIINCKGGMQLRVVSALSHNPWMRIAFHSQNKAKIALCIHAATVLSARIRNNIVRFEVLKAVLLKIQIILDRTLRCRASCSPTDTITYPRIL